MSESDQSWGHWIFKWSFLAAVPGAIAGISIALRVPEQETLLVLSLLWAEGMLGIGFGTAGIQMLQFVFGGEATTDRVADALLWAGAFVGCGACMTTVLGGIMNVYKYPGSSAMLETGLMGLAGSGLLAVAAVLKRRM